jgi:hypothetical protein
LNPPETPIYGLFAAASVDKLIAVVADKVSNNFFIISPKK